MEWILFLVGFPLVVGFLVLVIPVKKIRDFLVRVGALVILAASVAFFAVYFRSESRYFSLESELIGKILFSLELAMSALIVFLSIRHRRFPVLGLALVQAGLMVYFEIFQAKSGAIENGLFLDRLSLLMVLVVGVIGSLICVYAVSYMKKFHAHHHEIKNRKGLFFFLLFVFLSAMFGIVLSNSILWLFFFWEVTTLCSFLLIGYTRTPEARSNSYLALSINLIGGIAFLAAIVFFYAPRGILGLSDIISNRSAGYLLPAALLCLAGLTKSAQLPFSRWLLGAMVAPTPTSALLHSSTMVKAGVYLVLRLSPVLQNTVVGHMVALTGGITFLFGSLIAVSQSNAKRVLAYSTIANLGLIVACAGIGTYETVWAGIFLILFHAVAKSLLFLNVGTIEHGLETKDVESMDNLIVRMPKLALLVSVGIAGMFLAPFGMLISKWKALEAFIKVNEFMSPVLVIILSYGSAATVLFWTKWLGKISAINNRIPRVTTPLERIVTADEWVSQGFQAVLVIALCVAFPFVSRAVVEPYLNSVFGYRNFLDPGTFRIMIIMVAMILLLPVILLLLQYRKPRSFGDAYMSGRVLVNRNRFEGSAGRAVDQTFRNYYLEKFFGEKKLLKAGILLASLAVAAMLGVSLL